MQASKPKVIKWGIIGLGKIAHKFAQDLQTVDGCELYAVASRSSENASEFAKTYKAVVFYDSYEALAKDENIDAVYIATPHSFHKEHSILCLNHKKAVLCEKPFAMNLEEVSEMIANAKANNTLLMEALWTYFLPHYRYVLDALQTERYGKLLKLEADFGFQPEINMNSRVFKKSLGGGSLLDIGIYPIFAALSTLGVPNEINAKARFFDNNVDASCDMIFNYKDDVRAYLKSTLLENTPTEAIFYCEKGTIKINSRFHEPSTVTLILDGSETTLNFDYKTIGYSYEIAHFNQLIRDGKTESDAMTFVFSKLIIQTLDAVRNQIGLNY
uniref:Gfo/Idh/MocA family protein n=1 Tax=Gelidibacter sp. TaxID=2018083 RepID=UPI00404AC29B